MSDDKLSEAFQAVAANASDDEIITALVRTRLTGPDRKTLDWVRGLLSGEHLATRRSDILRRITERYGRGGAFRGNLKSAIAEAQDRVAAAAPEARRLWLADSVAVSGTRAELIDLAGHEQVARVYANPVYRVPEVLQTPLEDSPETVDGSTWGVARIGAPEVWGGLGRGGGVLVGHLDTGVDDTHPALAGKVTAFQEFDALGSPVVSAPHDSDAHGTHTAGTIAGRTVRGMNIGVAPDARLASALVLPGGSGSFAQIVAGLQWVIDQGAHVVSMSLSAPGHSAIWNLPMFNTVMSGVVVVASIGDNGQGISGGPGNDLM
ncbi:S8 family serine peptidase, partial [Nonomuraea sp. K274]